LTFDKVNLNLNLMFDEALKRDIFAFGEMSETNETNET
jgi:hypothetical protein